MRRRKLEWSKRRRSRKKFGNCREEEEEEELEEEEVEEDIRGDVCIGEVEGKGEVTSGRRDGGRR